MPLEGIGKERTEVELSSRQGNQGKKPLSDGVYLMKTLSPSELELRFLVRNLRRTAAGAGSKRCEKLA
jgi:hypothetical protein